MKNLFLAFLLILALFSCKDDDDAPENPQALQPTVSIADVTVTEADEDFDTQLTISLSREFSAPVVLTYATADGEASGLSDFERTENAELIIPAGSTEGTVTVRIRGDEAEEMTETFEVLILNAVNATVERSRATVTILDDDDPDSNVLQIPETGYETPESYEGMQLVWEDDFDAATINQDDWTFEIGTGNNGWGNNELQYYRAENAYIAQSDYLVIEAKNEAFGGSDYTSTRMITQDKQEFQYGRIDIRAVLPEGQGIWPALWMLGENFQEVGWPQCGEIDIMELVGHQPNRVHATVHYPNADGNHTFTGTSDALTGGAKFSDEFHVFSLIWEEDKMEFLRDGEVYQTLTPDILAPGQYPFNHPFFFIFNVAVGGQWPGSPDASTSFPQRMIVDYVRVFQES